MMADLHEQLRLILQGRVCLVGVGNTDYGDDGFGVRLAEALGEFASFIIAGNAPERCLGQLTEGGFNTVLFLDSVDFGAAPGAVALLNSGETTARFPQISTHRMSLGLLAKWVEARGTAKAWLLGVQPESLKPGGEFTPRVQTTLEILRDLLGEVLARVERKSIPTGEAA
jgi:hydrogenase maturation protease